MKAGSGRNMGGGKAPDAIGPQTALQRRSASTEAGFAPLVTMPKDVPEQKRGRWERLAKRAATQPRAAIELKCLECCAWYRPEVLQCQIAGCALFALSVRIFGRRTNAGAECEGG